MFEFHEKRRLKRILYSRPFLVFMLLPLGFMWYQAWHAYRAERTAQQSQADLAAELAKLEDRAHTLEGNLNDLEDPRGVEAELRQRYDVGKEGEQVIVLVDNDKPKEEQPAPPPKEPTLWERLRSWF